MRGNGRHSSPIGSFRRLEQVLQRRQSRQKAPQCALKFLASANVRQRVVDEVHEEKEAPEVTIDREQAVAVALEIDAPAN